MTAVPEGPGDRSGRRSDRVKSRDGVLPGQLGALAVKAPESLSPPGSALQAAHPNATAGTRQRVSRRQLAHLADRLSARDQAVLASVQAWRFLTAAQLQALHFTAHSTDDAAARICRRSLARLQRLGLIEHLNRRIGGLRAGSAGYVWRLAPAGERLRQQADGLGVRRRHKEPSARYLDHCQAVADCYLAMVNWSRADHADRGELVAVEPEPTCWRRFLGVGGSREILKPDLYAVTASGDYEDHWFIEVDRATESLPTLLRKCAQYERYRRTGRAQADGGVFPRVVWLVPDEHRRQQLLGGIRRSHQLDDGLFRVVTADDLPGLLTGGAS